MSLKAQGGSIFSGLLAAQRAMEHRVAWDGRGGRRVGEPVGRGGWMVVHRHTYICTRHGLWSRGASERRRVARWALATLQVGRRSLPWGMGEQSVGSSPSCQHWNWHDRNRALQTVDALGLVEGRVELRG